MSFSDSKSSVLRGLFLLIILQLVIHTGCKDKGKSGTADISNYPSDEYVADVGEWLGPLGNFRNGRSAETNWNQNR